MDLSHLLNAAPTEALATQMTPVPEGDWMASIDDLTFKQVKTKNGDRPVMTVTWEIHDEGLKAQMDREQIMVRQDLWLDLDETGGLATGQDMNVALGRLRQVFGQNEPGVPLGALKGTGRVLIHVKHRKVEGRDGVFQEVDRVAPLP